MTYFSVKKMAARVPNVLEDLQGREHPSFWGDGSFENITDKRGNANFMLRDTSKSIHTVYEEIGMARDPRVLKQIAKILQVGHNYVNKIILNYVSEHDMIYPDFEEYYNPFDISLKCHNALQKNIKKLNDSIYQTTNATKLDKLCFRVQRACHFFHLATIYFEVTERNVHGY